MKFWTISFGLFCLFLSGAAATATDQKFARDLLKKAFDATAKESYIAELKTPDIWDPHVTSGVFFRLVDSDGFVYRRMELQRDNLSHPVFWQNRDGQYGQVGDTAGKIGEVLLLSIPDRIADACSVAEIGFAKFELSDSEYQGIPCFRLKMAMPTDNAIKVAIVSGRPANLAADPNDEIYTIWPFVRVFLIGKDDNVIYSRTHYNAIGKQIDRQTLGKIRRGAKPTRDLFDSPSTLICDVPYRGDFMEHVIHPVQPPPGREMVHGLGNSLGNILDHGVNCLLAPEVIDGFATFFFWLAAGLIAFLFGYKWWSRRREGRMRRAPRRR